MPTIYRGSCHCGQVRFEVTAELDHVRVCDCSICRRRGALNHRVEEGAMRILTPLEALAVYEWNTRVAKDYFCPTCGVSTFRRPRSAPRKWDVNVRCLDGVELEALPVKRVEGSALSVPD
jgi:hypothetical protein